MTTTAPLQLLDAGAATTAAKQYTHDRWRVVVSGQAATFQDTAGNVLVSMNFPMMMRAIPAAAIVFAGSTENASVPGGVAGITPMSAYLPFAVTAANGYVIGLVVAFDAEITA